MSLRFHEIVEADHRIINPLTLEKLMLLGRLCRLTPEMQLLDLACGKGEMLCQWSAEFGVSGVGVDHSKVFLQEAYERAPALGVADKISFVDHEAADYARNNRIQYDVVSCIGATWIGDGLVGTIELLKPALRDESSLMLIGEPYWQPHTPEDAYVMSGVGKDEFTTLVGTLDRIESTGFELVEMVLASPDSWDRYAAEQWRPGSDWLRANPNHPDADEFRVWLDNARRNHLAIDRHYLGWGVFVLRQKK